MASTTSADEAVETAPTEGRSEREAEEARRANIRGDILAAAGRLIAEQGESFTTQEITKEAGVALQTFYRYFGGKDQLLLAVIEDMVAGHCANLEARTRGVDDPVDRLHTIVHETLGVFRPGDDLSAPRFITSQHWRLLQVDPAGMSAASQPFTDLVEREVRAGQAQGRFTPRDPAADAWLITKLVVAVFHHFAFAEDGAGLDNVADDVWQFCLAALGGPTKGTTGR